MHSTKTTNEYGQDVITWTPIPGDEITRVVAQITDEKSGTVSVYSGRLCVLSFDHPAAALAAQAMSASLYNAWGSGLHHAERS